MRVLTSVPASARAAHLPNETYLKNKKEAARYLGISVGSLRRLMRSNLPYVRVGSLVRFRPEDLADYIEQCRVRRERAQ